MSTTTRPPARRRRLRASYTLLPAWAGVALTITLASLAIAAPTAASDLRVANGWVGLPISKEDPSAYFVILSRSPQTRTIVGAKSSRCASISIRRTAVVDGQWASEAMPDGMSIPPRGSVAFAPRGLFLRLMSAEKLTEGETVPIVLEFADGETVPFDAIVKDN